MTHSQIDACFLTNLVGRDFTRQAERLTFYTNATSCILSRARCSAYNPITGELQVVTTASGRLARYNALQISPAGDIRLVAFGGATAVAEYFCSATRQTLEQASFDNADC